jgi:hypothetical protein
MISSFVRSFVCLILVAFVTACTTVEFASSKVDEHYPPRRQAKDIELFRSGHPSKSFFEIGAVSACCGDANAMTDLLREKAALSGGDALIGLDLRAGGGATATVIRYQDSN